jgi:hypothetical protein
VPFQFGTRTFDALFKDSSRRFDKGGSALLRLAYFCCADRAFFLDAFSFNQKGMDDVTQSCVTLRFEKLR